MPQLGESITEGQVVRWLKSPGQAVARFEPLVEVLTDKVTVQVPSPADGTLLAVQVPEGQTVPVGTVLALLEPAHAEAGAPAVPAPPQAGRAGPQAPAGGAPAAPTPPPDGPAGERGLYSPAVRRLAREHGIDLSQLRGTGEGGRITREDVLRAIQDRSEAPRQPPPAPEPFVDLEPTGVRAVIARRLSASWTSIPHAWTMVEADVTALAALRQQLQESVRQREGLELTFLPFALKAVAEALREVPQLNAAWVDGRIRQYRHIHVGVAVGLEQGLVVPVVRDADRLSVLELARRVHALVEQAREGRLSPDQLQGATFTLNNTGALGSILSGPLISPSQGAVLTTEAATRRLVVLKDDQLAIRTIMNLCLSFDHRLCDGVHALRFLQGVRRRLEAYGPGTPLT